eukprot:TRINITY_DN1555_c0_g3_i3.p1 TRINITY_DN1555_c0_g3~~TRINITY_DN1555_c0_g3_i3.p1  ORF type:complete len:236 (+),score=71.46 TRINITY_DN1555_c0_g3_i3:279-986(+)
MDGLTFKSIVYPTTQETPGSEPPLTPKALPKVWKHNNMALTPPPPVNIEGKLHKPSPMPSEEMAMSQNFLRDVEKVDKEVEVTKKREEEKRDTTRRRNQEEARLRLQKEKQLRLEAEADRKQKELAALLSLVPPQTLPTVSYNHPSVYWAPQPTHTPMYIRNTQTFKWLLSPSSKISQLLTPRALDLKRCCITNGTTSGDVIKTALDLAKQTKPEDWTPEERDFEAYCLTLINEK